MSQTFSSLRFLDGHSYQHSAAFKNPSWNMKYGIQKYVVVTKQNLVREVMLDEILTFISRMSSTKFDMQVRNYVLLNYLDLFLQNRLSVCFLFLRCQTIFLAYNNKLSTAQLLCGTYMLSVWWNKIWFNFSILPMYLSICR